MSSASDVIECKPGEWPALKHPLDQRIGEHISIVRLGDVPGMPEELRGVVFVLDRDAGRRSTPPDVTMFVDAPWKKGVEVVTHASGYAHGLIVAANALRGIEENFDA